MSLRYIALAILLLVGMDVDTPAHAIYHYVANPGTNSAACTATAPCADIDTAINNASPNDTVICLTPVASFVLNISKSIDIECSGSRAVFRTSAAGGTAISINIAASSSDPLRTVRLRGISVDGANVSTGVVTPTGRLANRGIDIAAAPTVYLEDVIISDVIQQGVFDHRIGGQTRLFITDSIIRNNGGPGIV